MEAEGARRERIAAVIGPTISQRNYEVGPEFEARFVAADAYDQATPDSGSGQTGGYRPFAGLADLLKREPSSD